MGDLVDNRPDSGENSPDFLEKRPNRAPNEPDRGSSSRETFTPRVLSDSERAITSGNRMIRKALNTARVAEVWEMRTKQGLSNADIARALGISPATVANYLAEVLREAKLRLFEDVERWKIEQHHKYDFLYAESIAAWESSKKEKKRQTLKYGKPPRRGGEGSPTPPDEIKRTTEERNGDPRYLTSAMAALAGQAKLWGLNAPDQLETNNRSLIAVASVTGKDEQDAIRQAEEAFRKARYGERTIPGKVTGAVVPAVRQDQPPDEGENPL